MDIVIRRVLDRHLSAVGDWTLTVEAELGETVVERCRVTVSAQVVQTWMKSVGLAEEHMRRVAEQGGGSTRSRAASHSQRVLLMVPIRGGW